MPTANSPQQDAPPTVQRLPDSQKFKAVAQILSHPEWLTTKNQAEMAEQIGQVLGVQISRQVAVHIIESMGVEWPARNRRDATKARNTTAADIRVMQSTAIVDLYKALGLGVPDYLQMLAHRDPLDDAYRVFLSRIPTTTGE